MRVILNILYVCVLDERRASCDIAWLRYYANYPQQGGAQRIMVNNA